MYRTAEDVVIREQGGRAFLLHLKTARYYELNATGLLAWKAIAAGEDPAAALAAAHTTVDELTLRADLEKLMGELLDAGLIRPASG